MENSNFSDTYLGWSPEMREYFNTLPVIVKQSLVESGAIVSSLEDLKQKTAHLKDNVD